MFLADDAIRVIAFSEWVRGGARVVRADFSRTGFPLGPTVEMEIIFEVK